MRFRVKAGTVAACVAVVVIVLFSMVCIRIVVGAGEKIDGAASDERASVSQGDMDAGSSDLWSDADGSDDGDGTQGHDAGASMVDPSQACPLSIVPAELVSVGADRRGVSWTYRSTVGIDRVVENLLDQLEEGGFSLDRAMTLDLYGQAWGCVAHHGQDVLLVQAVPETLTAREADALLVTVVRMEAQGDGTEDPS